MNLCKSKQQEHPRNWVHNYFAHELGAPALAMGFCGHVTLSCLAMAVPLAWELALWVPTGVFRVLNVT
jgi:hypothetical protein